MALVAGKAPGGCGENGSLGPWRLRIESLQKLISWDIHGDRLDISYILVGGLEHFLFSHILGRIIPID